MQCHDIFRGAKLPRSNQKRGQQASEHDTINAGRMNNRPINMTGFLENGWFRVECRLNFWRACLYWFHHE